MSFDPLNIDLPIVEIIPQVREHLAKQNTLIVNAPPGAGKSTLLPLALLEEEWLQGKKIIMLEPRRLASKTIAMRMASLLEEETGEKIGYRVRFETRVSNKTKLVTRVKTTVNFNTAFIMIATIPSLQFIFYYL